MATASTSSLETLQSLGQCSWIDFISRKFLETGDLARLIEEDNLQGVTSNPTIFDKAISKSDDYDDQFREVVRGGGDSDAVYYALTSTDVRNALDLFRPTYDRTEGRHGFVSLEVSPVMAHSTEQTVAEAKKLWEMLDRPNAMIKIPGTAEGLPAIEESLFNGINVNVTLLFSVEAYETVAKAYIKALQRRADAGLPVDRIASVASFFVSRIDAEVDKRIDARLEKESDTGRRTALESLKGKIAIANAKNAYASYEKLFGSPEFEELRAKGAQVQRPLWASVGTKDPSYPDTLYIDSLIGPETVSTMPPETYDAFKDHGQAASTLTEGLDEARAQIEHLGELGIDFKDVTDTMLSAGVDSFIKSFESLMEGIKTKHAKFAAEAR